MKKCWIFDFDGTLVDSEKAIQQCFIKTTKALTPDRLHLVKDILIGPPLRDTAKSILGPNNFDKVDLFVSMFIDLHDNRVIHDSKPYPMANEILTTLYELNNPIAIATNKRMEPTLKLIDYLGWRSFFVCIECSDSQKKVRDKKKMIGDIIRQYPKFSEATLVGDTVGDGESAKSYKLPFIRAHYGYGRKQDWSSIPSTFTIKELGDLKSIIT